MFIPLQPLKRRFYSVFTANKREYDILLSDGLSESDSITVNLPQGYIVESLPKPKLMATPFGTLLAKAEKRDDALIVYTQYINLPAGRYDKSQYDDIKNFFKEIVSATKARVVVRKVD